MNVKDFVEESLKKAGYGGLFNADVDCACVLGDLMPCESPDCGECCTGYKVACADAACDGYGLHGHFHVAACKPSSCSS